MITYNIDDNSVFYVKFKNKVSFEDIIDYLTEFKSFKSLPEDLLLVYDMIHADLTLTPGDIPEISDLADKATEKFKSVKTAFIVSKPKIADYSVLFSGLKKNEKTERQIFSTHEKALNWLLEE